MKIFVKGSSGFVGGRILGRRAPGDQAPRSDLWALVGTFDDQSWNPGRSLNLFVRNDRLTAPTRSR